MSSTTTKYAGDAEAHDVPGDEEDLSRAAAWTDPDKSDDEQTTPISKKWKGKARAVDPGSDTDESVEADGDARYPPIRDEELEEKRVTETLRKWELQERQRRKLSRDVSMSTAASAPPSSVVEDVSRRASSLWSQIGGTTKKKRPSAGSHKMLTDEDSYDVDSDLRLSRIEASPLASPIPPSTPTKADTPDQALGGRPQNPFDDPSSSPDFSDRQPHSSLQRSTSVAQAHHDTFMTASSHAPEPGPGPDTEPKPSSQAPPDRPILKASSSFSSRPPPPQPFELLPPPKTPPPRIHTPDSVTPRPPRSERDQSDLEPPERRWWTEWLCGCSEGDDRGGHNQAGRTNPFE